jgi:hypothetical protein
MKSHTALDIHDTCGGNYDIKGEKIWAMKQKNLKHKECVTIKTIYKANNCESENSTQ